MNNLQQRLNAMALSRPTSVTPPLVTRRPTTPPQTYTIQQQLAREILYNMPYEELRGLKKNCNSYFSKYAIVSEHDSVLGFFRDKFQTTDLSMIFTIYSCIDEIFQIRLNRTNEERNQVVDAFLNGLSQHEKQRILANLLGST